MSGPKTIRDHLGRANEYWSICKGAPALRVEDGRYIVTGQTWAKLRVAVDVRVLVQKTMEDQDPYGARVFSEWLMGKKVREFSGYGRGKLAKILDKLRDKIRDGGYYCE